MGCNGALLLLLLLRPAVVLASCRRTEVAALWQLYELTGGAYWKQNTNWDPNGDPCALNKRWVGVGVRDPCNRYRDGEDCKMGRITSLYLDSNNLTGSLSGWSQLRTLRNLTLLDLSFNSVAGTLPTELGRLSSIDRITWNDNQLVGTIPTQIGEINRPALSRELDQIMLANNALSGSVPTELAAHSELSMVDMRNNSLAGTLPTEVGSLSNLAVLHVHDNARLSGTLPGAMTPMQQLHYLDASRTRLSGTLPPGLGSLPLLHSIQIQTAALSGTIPAELTDVYVLRMLRLADNQLVGNLPEQVGKLRNLLHLDVYNNSMSGDVPPSIRELGNLEELYLGYEHLLPLRRRYCGQRLPNLGKYSWILVSQQYDDMMESHCPEEQMHDTSFTFSTLQDSGVYEM